MYLRRIGRHLASTKLCSFDFWALHCSFNFCMKTKRSVVSSTTDELFALCPILRVPFFIRGASFLHPVFKVWMGFILGNTASHFSLEKGSFGNSLKHVCYYVPARALSASTRENQYFFSSLFLLTAFSSESPSDHLPAKRGCRLR